MVNEVTITINEKNINTGVVLKTTTKKIIK
jgi:hypothetical protein